MDETQEGPAEVPTGQRMKHMGTEMVRSIAHKLSGKEGRDQKSAAYILDQAEVEPLIEEWPAGPRTTARETIQHYGPPNEASPIRLTWYRNGPLKRTELVCDEIAHDFPAPHTDYITNWIDYRVPVESSRTSPGMMEAVCWIGPQGK